MNGKGVRGCEGGRIQEGGKANKLGQRNEMNGGGVWVVDLIV